MELRQADGSIMWILYFVCFPSFLHSTSFSKYLVRIERQHHIVIRNPNLVLDSLVLDPGSLLCDLKQVT